MDLNGFRDLVEQSRDHSPDPEPDARLDRLEGALARRPAADVLDFQIRQDETRRQSALFPSG